MDARESAWQRGWSDTKALHAHPFVWLAELGLAFFIGGWWFPIILIALFFIVFLAMVARAPVLQRDESRQALLKIEEERPIFNVKFISVIGGGALYEGSDEVILAIFLRFWNSGAIKSFAQDWQIFIIDEGGREVLLEMPSYETYSFGTENGTQTFSRSDRIDVKTIQAVEIGDAVEGFLCGVCKEALFGRLTSNEAKLEVKVLDFAGNIHQFSLVSLSALQFLPDHAGMAGRYDPKPNNA